MTEDEFQTHVQDAVDRRLEEQDDNGIMLLVISGGLLTFVGCIFVSILLSAVLSFLVSQGLRDELGTDKATIDQVVSQATVHTPRKLDALHERLQVAEMSLEVYESDLQDYLEGLGEADADEVERMVEFLDSNQQALLLLIFWLENTPDTDGDGFVDFMDLCPETVGGEIYSTGCNKNQAVGSCTKLADGPTVEGRARFTNCPHTGDLDIVLDCAYLPLQNGTIYSECTEVLPTSETE